MARATVPTGVGVVRGVVKFTGPRPPLKVIGGDCFPGATVVLDESAIVNADGTLKNVAVFVKDGPNVQTPDLPEAVLTQKSCQYVPHVRALRVGQILSVTSHDSTPHNVHIESIENPGDNFSELQGGSHAVHFDHAGVVRFKCDVHPWMTAYVHVFDHPCYAVTGDDGTFEIGKLPAGTYTLIARHEKFGDLEKSFTVQNDKPVTVNFEYSP